MLCPYQSCAILDIIKHLCFLQTCSDFRICFVPAEDFVCLHVWGVTVICATLQTDHHAIGQLSTSNPQQSLAVEAKGAQACEDCSSAQRDLKQRLEIVEAAQAARDSKHAQSMPSTQDHSGDTNDDRYGSSMSAAADKIILNLFQHGSKDCCPTMPCAIILYNV